MLKPREKKTMCDKMIKMTATLKTLGWDSKVSDMTFDGEAMIAGYDSKKFMHALNLGDISNLPKPIPFTKQIYVSGYNDGSILEMFKNVKNPYVLNEAESIESETLYGTIRYVVKRGKKQVERWEYVNEPIK